MNPIETLTSLGQSLWYDNIQRKLLDNGELNAMIQRGEIRGVTSNPTIFNNAIAKTSDYDAALVPLAWSGWEAESIFWELAVEDIREACDLFTPLYIHSNGGDGYVSLEVNPFLANDTDGTVAQAEQLWARVARPNLMVKIPATKAGIPAVRKAISAGVNVNVTLIFSLQRYAEVMTAYLDGLEDRLSAGRPIDHVASVASFFVSRLDSKIDPMLPDGSLLRGKAAVANAKLAYESFSEVIKTKRWADLKRQGARVQRPLWASTGTKNPNYSKTIYVDNLIGPETVNTVPPATLDAFRKQGVAKTTVTNNIDEARSIFTQLETLGISMESVTQELEQEGVKSFADAFRDLLSAVDEKRRAAVSELGPLAGSLPNRLSQLDANSVPERLWRHDPNLWVTTSAGKSVVETRMGWLDSPEKARARIPVYESFANQIHDEGIDRVLVLGMGGSSLTAEVFSSLLAGAKIESPLSLAILDSTDPRQVKQATTNFPPSKSLYIVASKSGDTAEVMAMFDLFWQLSDADGSRFVAITDPKTDLEKLAQDRNFRKIFLSDELVGGRYSALSDFGLIPAALLGMDLSLLLDRADWMKRQCGDRFPAARNPGIVLGVALAEAVMMGRDKLTVLADPPLTSLANWIEQIIAESTGKQGKGILPVASEPLGEPGEYGQDRLFVYLHQNGELEEPVIALKDAGYPVIQFTMGNPHEVGAEFFRWEVATVVASHILGVNPFDQPDVQDSKSRTKAGIENYKRDGKLIERDLVTGVEILPALKAFLSSVNPGDFVALNAYLPREKKAIDALQELRVVLRSKLGCAVTAGFGPRFHHSTGQFHKGAQNKGWFIQILSHTREDIDIPTEGLTFGILLRAQAMGDYEALISANRHVIRLQLKSDYFLEINRLADTIAGW